MSSAKFCQFIFTSGFSLLIINYFSEKKVLCLSIDFLKNRKNPFFPRDMKILKQAYFNNFYKIHLLLNSYENWHTYVKFQELLFFFVSLSLSKMFIVFEIFEYFRKKCPPSWIFLGQTGSRAYFSMFLSILRLKEHLCQIWCFYVDVHDFCTNRPDYMYHCHHCTFCTFIR